MNAYERFSAIIHGEEPDRVGVMSATGLRVGSQGGVFRRLADRGLCLRDIVPPHTPFFSYPGAANPFLPDVTYSETYYLDRGSWHIRAEITTPVGEISAVSARSSEVDVASDSPVEHFVKQPGDWEIVNDLFRRMLDALKPNDEEIRRNQDEMGDQGLTIGIVDRSPFQRAWIELASLQETVIECFDPSPGFQEYLEIQETYHRKIAEISAASPAELILINDNITNTISPSLYSQHCTPIYQIYAEAFSSSGKVLAVHHDGLLNSLKNEIADAPFTVVDSFTLPPAGDLDLLEARKLWPGKVFFVNLPPFLAHKDDDEVERFYEQVIQDWGSKQLVFVHVEDYPEDKLERHFSILMDVCGY